jgi:hypothetical protein
VALAPAIYWERSLRSELGAAVREWEQTRQKALKSEGGSVDVSVSKHGQKKFTKPFKDTNINWAIIENQLLKWGDFFHEGKVLNLDLTFKYVEDPQPFNTAPRGRNNRGRLSRTQRMLAEGEMLQVAEEGSGALIFKDLFEIFRCRPLFCLCCGKEERRAQLLSRRNTHPAFFTARIAHHVVCSSHRVSAIFVFQVYLPRTGNTMYAYLDFPGLWSSSVGAFIVFVDLRSRNSGGS